MILAVLSISAVGFFVWAHHMFVAGLAEDTRLYFSSATMVIAIPTAVKIFTWLSSLARSAQPLSQDMLITLIFLLCFTCGGFTGLVLSNSALDVLLHDTYYVVGHFHFVLSIAATLAALLIIRSFLAAALRSGASSSLGRLALFSICSALN
jgi:cytochrome c oxidase subunit 1